MVPDGKADSVFGPGGTDHTHAEGNARPGGTRGPKQFTVGPLAYSLWRMACSLVFAMPNAVWPERNYQPKVSK